MENDLYEGESGFHHLFGMFFSSTPSLSKLLASETSDESKFNLFSFLLAGP